MAIIVVHGIHSDGNELIAFANKLRDKTGKEVKLYHYPKRSFIGQWFGTHKKDGKALANYMTNGDHIVCHSNGALLWHESIKAQAKWGKCFVFSGAATSDKMLYPQDAFEMAYIIYNPKDLALRLGSWLPFHPFGRLGWSGYRGTKRKDIKNIEGYSKEHFLNHSHYFHLEINKWVDFVTSKI